MVREEFSLLFREGAYIPVKHEGNPHRISFARKLGNVWVIISCPIPGWQAEETTVLHMPSGAPDVWKNCFTGEVVVAIKRKLPAGNCNDCVKVLLLVAQEF